MSSPSSIPTDLLPRALAGRSIDQLCFLVEDLETAIQAWSPVYGDEWRIYTYHSGNVNNLTYRGGPGQFVLRLALAGSSPQIELIQPLEGPSIYHDWIEEHGYGFHHLGFFVPDVAASIAEFEAAGIPNIQSGNGYGLDGDGGFAYFDLEGTHQHVLEAIEVPARRRESEAR